MCQSFECAKCKYINKWMKILWKYNTMTAIIVSLDRQPVNKSDLSQKKVIAIKILKVKVWIILWIAHRLGDRERERERDQEAKTILKQQVLFI